MLIPQVVGLLQAKCAEVGHAGAAQVDVTVLKAAVEGLQDNQALTQQIEQLQEQMSMKPSVARKLAEKIKKLEEELEITRDASRVKELERKVQKLELDLKQSYSTKNFTLKKGLLDLEKQYHAHIYGHPDMKELWQEVMVLLVEEKDRDRPALDGPPVTGNKRTHPGRRSMRLDSTGQVPAGESMPSSPLIPDSRGSGSIMSVGKETALHTGAVQRTVDQIQEVHGKDAPLALHFPGQPQSANVTPRHQRSGSSTSIPGIFGAITPEDAVQKAHQDMTASLDALRSMFLQPSAPVFPKDLATAAFATPAATTTSGDPSAAAPQESAAAQSELEALQLSVEKLLELWSQRVGSGLGGSWLLSSSASGGHKRGKSGGAAHVDASYFDTQADAVMASLASLRDKYQGGGLPLIGGQGQNRQSTPGGKGLTPDASYFDQTADALAASIAHLRALWAVNSGKGGLSYTPHGLPPLPARGPGAPTPSTPTDNTQEDLRRVLLAHSHNPFMPQISIKDLISYFMDFMKSGGWRPDGRGGRTWMSAGADGTPQVDGQGTDGCVDGTAGSSVMDVIQQFAEYLREVGRPDLAVALALFSSPQETRAGSLGSTGAASTRPAPATSAGASTGAGVPSWLPLLPALRLSTTAAAGGVPTAPASALLDAALAPEGAPSWWTASLEAAARQGDAAVITHFDLPSSAKSVGSRADGSRHEGPSDLSSLPASSAAGTAAQGSSVVVDAATGNVALSLPPSGGAVTDVQTAATQAATTTPATSSQGGDNSAPATAGQTAISAAATTAPAGSGSLPSPPAPFNPLLLPGPARTMQAVMAYVRHKHKDFLDRHPEAEVLLTEALAAAAELQAVQDRSLIRMAVGKKHAIRLGSSPLGQGSGKQSPTAASMALANTSGGSSGDLFGVAGALGTASAFGAAGGVGAAAAVGAARAAPVAADSALALTRPPIDGQLSITGVDVHSTGAGGNVQGAPGAAGELHVNPSSASFAFPTMASSANAGSAAADGNAPASSVPTPHTYAINTSEIEPADDVMEAGGVAVQGSTGVVEDHQGDDVNFNVQVTSAELTVDDYAAELAEVRAIASRHAEHAAALQELLARVATQHATAMERADDLEMRLSLGEREVDLLREEVDMLTRLLVDVKMAYAERDMEAQRLAQRLKRSLAGENAARDELEELRHKLAVVGEDMVVMDSDYGDMMHAALGGLSLGDALGPSPPGTDEGSSVGGHPQLRVRTNTGLEGNASVQQGQSAAVPLPAGMQSHDIAITQDGGENEGSVHRQ